MLLSWTCVLLLCLCSSTALGAVVSINFDTFDDWANGEYMLVALFYSDGCGSCLKADSEFRQSATSFAHSSDVIFTQINVIKDPVLAARFNIKDVPVVKFFPFTLLPTHYPGRIRADELTAAVRESRLTGLNSRQVAVKDPKSSESRTKRKKRSGGAKEIVAGEFSGVVLDPKKHVMLELYSQGCVLECNIFDRVADIFKNDDNVLLAKMDVSKSPDVVRHFRVSTNPTLVWFPISDKQYGKIFGGTIELLVLTEFLNDHTGNHRDLSGNIKDNAGRIAKVDEILSENIADVLVGHNMNYIIDATEKAGRDHPSATRYVTYYLSILKEIQKGRSIDTILAKENTYITTQMNKRNISQKEIDEWIKFRNIVSAFYEYAAEQLKVNRKKKSAGPSKLLTESKPQKTEGFRQSSRARDEL